jgi:hypothetical protein
MNFKKPETIGPGSKSWTIIFQELNGVVTSRLAMGSHDKFIVWGQAQKYFRNRVLAILPGNHQVVTKKDMS